MKKPTYEIRIRLDKVPDDPAAELDEINSLFNILDGYTYHPNRNATIYPPEKIK